jgi:nitrous oxide reductase accessory protein NosL
VTSRRARCGATLAVITCLAAGCGSEETLEPTRSRDPVEITDQEGAVCGMLLREQTAPRAQVVHRDGERSFICSISDLLAYLDAPSPHGRVIQVLVEVMDPSQDPALPHTNPHPWVDSEDAVYVVGIERSGVMGEPVLTYHDRVAAERVIQGTSARILGFDELRSWWAGIQGAATRH